MYAANGFQEPSTNVENIYANRDFLSAQVCANIHKNPDVICATAQNLPKKQILRHKTTPSLHVYSEGTGGVL